MPARDNLTKEEAADYLRISRATLDRLVKKRLVPHAKLGKRVIFRKRDLDALLEKHLVK